MTAPLGMVIQLLLAALFFVVFCVVVFGGVVRLAKGGSRASFTGPVNREVDYDHPYGLGGYLWPVGSRDEGSRHAGRPPGRVGEASDRGDAWPGWPQSGADAGAGEDAPPA